MFYIVENNMFSILAQVIWVIIRLTRVTDFGNGIRGPSCTPGVTHKINVSLLMNTRLLRYYNDESETI